MVRNDAVRENDVVRIIRHWRYDLLKFYEPHHHLSVHTGF